MLLPSVFRTPHAMNLSTVFHTTANAPSTCPNEPLIYPTRLRIPETLGKTLYQLYAYPTQRPSETLVQLQTLIPPLVDYVLGPDWRDSLSERRTMRVPSTNWTNEDEAAIALRMFRVGAATIDHWVARGLWWNLDDGFGWQWQSALRQQKYIFGWPSTGGAWVLGLPPLMDKHNPENLDLGEELAQHHRHMNGDPEVSRNVDDSIYFGDLVKSKTMDEYCEWLKAMGATFYEAIEASAEVLETGLMDAEVALKREPNSESESGPFENEHCSLN